MTDYYKVTHPDGGSFHDPGFKWRTGETVKVDNPDPPGIDCGRGVHLAKSIDAAFQMNAKFPARVFRIEPRSEILCETDDKIRVAEAWCGDDITPIWVTRVNRFLKQIPRTPWFKRVKPPRKHWKMFKTRDSVRASAWVSALVSARASAGASARASAWVSARASARDSARDSAGDSAGDSARDSAWDSAWDSARDSAWDSALYAQLLVVSDLDTLDHKHVLHIKRRWDVWQRGYGLLCDVDGVLYVYERP